MNDRDDELLAAARAGDAGALERLLERHQRRVFRFGLKMCGGEEEAKDVLQETLLAAARGIREFRGAASVSTWLYAIARSFCIKGRRTSKFAPAQVDSLSDVARQANEVPDQARGPDEVAAGAQVQSALQDAISALEPMYREILVLRDVEGLSAAEVAEITDLSVEAVKSRLHRARVSVRERLAPVLGLPEPARRAAEAQECPDIVDLFSRHLEGEISGSVCTTLEQHLLGCDRCRARCDSLRATLSLCSQSGDELPPRVEQSVRDALRRFLARER
jgi:RNA polymerase sigma-70 factor, ECF subfamily